MQLKGNGLLMTGEQNRKAMFPWGPSFNRLTYSGDSRPSVWAMMGRDMITFTKH